MQASVLFYVSLVLPALAIATRLKVSGKQFTYNGTHTFLSGGNLPWITYAYDYGNNQWAGVKDKVEEQFKLLNEAGGNSVRLWVHIQGESSPYFNGTGHPTATDKDGTLLDDIKSMLDLAQSYDLLVIPTLWNAAVDFSSAPAMDGLIRDAAKLQSYLDNVLKPLARHVKGHPAMGAWDIINEPEGMLKVGEASSERCFDTTKISDLGFDWTKKDHKIQDMLRFINWQADAIHQEDPEALVTVGNQKPNSATDTAGWTNHYSDECLYQAGERSLGHLDFYTYHCYSWNSRFDEIALLTSKMEDYNTTKPIVAGEFWIYDAGGKTDSELFEYFYNHGYAGAWSWDLGKFGLKQRVGIEHIRDFTGNGEILIDVE